MDMVKKYKLKENYMTEIIPKTKEEVQSFDLYPIVFLLLSEGKIITFGSDSGDRQDFENYLSDEGHNIKQYVWAN